MAEQFVFPEPDRTDFDKHGAYGTFFGTNSPRTQHLILKTKSDQGYDRFLRENESEFDYYVVEGMGEVVIDNHTHPIKPGDMIVIPPGHKFTFNGKLKLLLINTPLWSNEQEEEWPK
jgi:mannose-6-phosphate isomerase-like protein (cupin superfamily)